jgi:conjugal transfer pilus assembly protein TraI
VMLDAVKLASPAILFAGVDAAPPPLDATLVCRPGEPLPARPNARPAPAAPPGTQFSLIEAPSPDSEAAETPAATSPKATAPAPAPPPEVTLKAPMRLNPAVRDALAAVVQTLNESATTTAACTVASGLFIPLQELERRGIQPAVALRALADVRMLVHTDRNRPATVSRDFGGDTTVGLVIDPRFIDGFDMAGFVLPESAKD